MKRRDVVTSPGARDDLRRIYSLIADAGSPVNGVRFVERIAAFCQRLDIASERGVRRDDLRAGLRIVGFERRVSIAFAVEDDRVIILRIFYGGSNREDHFQ